MDIWGMSTYTMMLIVWGALGVLFLTDILRLLKKDRQSETFFSFTTTVVQELKRNLPSIAAYLSAFALIAYFQITTGAVGPVDIGLPLFVISLMLTYFFLPKRIVIGSRGVFDEGGLTHWDRIRRVSKKCDTVVVRRDRLFLLAPIKIPGDETGDIYEAVRERSGLKRPARGRSGLDKEKAGAETSPELRPRNGGRTNKEKDRVG